MFSNKNVEEDISVYSIDDTEFPYSGIIIDNIEIIKEQNNEKKNKLNLSINNKPIYVELPECSLKQDVNMSNTNKFCDLFYVYKDNLNFINWIEKIELICKNLIDEKKYHLFNSKIKSENIENMMKPICRISNLGKNIHLRTYINVDENYEDICDVYDNNENKKNLSYINLSKSIVPYICIESIDFTYNSIEIYISLIQVIVKSTKDDYNKSSYKRILKCKKHNNEKDICNKHDEENKKQLETIHNQEDVKETIHIQEDVKENVNIQEDVKETVNIQEDVKETIHIQDDVKENVNIQEDVKETIHIQEDKNFIEEKQNKENKNDKILEESEKNEELEELKEEELNIINTEILKLKKPNNIYYDKYKIAKQKALDIRKKLIKAYLKAKSIKTNYLLNEIDDSDEDENIDDSEEDNEDENI